MLRLAAGFCAVLLLAACGGGSKEAMPDDASGAATVVATETAAATAAPTATGAPAASTPATLPFTQSTYTPPPNQPFFDPKLAGQRQLNLAYCVVNGTPLRMDVYYPAGPVAGTWPAVVFIHGGELKRGDKQNVAGPPGAINFANFTGRGFVFVSINYRLAPDTKLPSMVEDVKCAIRHLRMRARAYNIDPNRIGAIGLSSGAYLAAMLGVTDASAGFEGHGAFEGVSSRVQAVVAEYAHYDYLRPSYSGAEREEREAALPPDASQDFLRAVSVYTYVSADDPPFAIYHGDADPALDPAQSEEMNRRLQAAGVTSSFTLVKNGGHGWLANSPRKAGVTDALTPTGTAIVAQELDFFDRYLKP